MAWSGESLEVQNQVCKVFKFGLLVSDSVRMEDEEHVMARCSGSHSQERGFDGDMAKSGSVARCLESGLVSVVRMARIFSRLG